MNVIVGRAASSRGDGVEYVLMETDSGGLVCGCPGWAYRRKCRHVAEWREAHPDWHESIDVGDVVIEDSGEIRECSGNSKDGKHQPWSARDRMRCWFCKLPMVKEEGVWVIAS